MYTRFSKQYSHVYTHIMQVGLPASQIHLYASRSVGRAVCTAAYAYAGQQQVVIRLVGVGCAVGLDQCHLTQRDLPGYRDCARLPDHAELLRAAKIKRASDCLSPRLIYDDLSQGFSPAPLCLANVASVGCASLIFVGISLIPGIGLPVAIISAISSNVTG